MRAHYLRGFAGREPRTEHQFAHSIEADTRPVVWIEPEPEEPPTTPGFRWFIYALVFVVVFGMLAAFLGVPR